MYESGELAHVLGVEPQAGEVPAADGAPMQIENRLS
jgi:hypothetical protein